MNRHLNKNNNLPEDTSQDYNSKFKQLSNKISTIASQTKVLSSACTRLENKLTNVESKCQSRFTSLDQKFTLLKDQYTKLTKQYEDNTQYQKQLKKELHSKQTDEKIKSQIQDQRSNLTIFINTIFNSIETNVAKILNLQEQESSSLKKEATEFQNEAATTIATLIDRIEKENQEQGQFIENIVNDSNKEFSNLYAELHKETKINEETKTEFLKNCKEVKEKMNDEFNKAKIQREGFEENIFNLIEDTCVKLSETSS